MGFSPAENERGTAYAAIGLALSVCVLIAFIIRIYTRAILTRSFGSDDIAISVSVCLTIIGEVGDVLEVNSGFGLHEQSLSSAQYSAVEKWQVIGRTEVIISWFFVRTSVMLFVLRLLPEFKKWEARSVYVAMIVNLAITLLAGISYGVSCSPFRANWDSIPGGRCHSKDVTVITTQINGGKLDPSAGQADIDLLQALACIIDITTALLPQFLLWNVQMKSQTKHTLNLIFCLGLLTAALSIGRAATSTRINFEHDSSWRLFPNEMFGMTEEKCGIIFACCPAIRQFVSYRQRVGTYLPSTHRQQPGEDLRKMRRRIMLRDMFWFRKPIVVNGRVFNPKSAFSSEQSSERLIEATEIAARASVLDKWYSQFKSTIFSKQSSASARSPSGGTYPLSFYNTQSVPSLDGSERGPEAYRL